MAVFINAIAPLSTVFAKSSFSEEDELSSLFGDKILICTPFGYKYVSFDELDDMDTSDQEDSASHCSLCQINTDEDKPYLADIKSVMAIEIHQAKSHFIVQHNILKSNRRFSPSIPRAPPVSL
ncbi:hypothetical protein LJF33_08735 [Emcibacteraceae bacterium Y4]|nr:hypothetical protein [Pseudemcibacter aquimaris]MCC3861288.1 hypothetical protein [Pseudemcibacter aquimaris]